MRRILTLVADVAAAVERLRGERSIGMSEAVNEPVRAGLTRRETGAEFRQQAHDLGPGVDFADVAEAIETLDGPTTR